MVFGVDKRVFGTNFLVLTLPKILVAIDQGQESLLSGRIKATITRIHKTRVECLMNNVYFQIEEAIDTSPGKFTYNRICPFVGKTLLL